MSSTQQKACTQCGTVAPAEDVVCMRCGRQFPRVPPPPGPPGAGPLSPQVANQVAYPRQPQPNQVPPGFVWTPPGTHSAILATILSGVFPWSGQLYNKQVIKGVVMFIVGIVVAKLFCLGIFAVWLMAIIDANRVGHRLNRGELVGQWQFF